MLSSWRRAVGGRQAEHASGVRSSLRRLGSSEWEFPNIRWKPDEHPCILAICNFPRPAQQSASIGLGHLYSPVSVNEINSVATSGRRIARTLGLHWALGGVLNVLRGVGSPARRKMMNSKPHVPKDPVLQPLSLLPHLRMRIARLGPPYAHCPTG